jgi:hypothetical protein
VQRCSTSSNLPSRSQARTVADAYTALIGGKSEITAHFASPPFSILELAGPKSTP